MSGATIPAGMVPYGPEHPDYPNAPKDWDGGRVYLERPSLKGGGEAWRWAGGSDEYHLDWHHNAAGTVPIIAYTPKPIAQQSEVAPETDEARAWIDPYCAWRNEVGSLIGNQCSPETGFQAGWSAAMAYAAAIRASADAKGGVA